MWAHGCILHFPVYFHCCCSSNGNSLMACQLVWGSVEYFDSGKEAKTLLETGWWRHDEYLKPPPQVLATWLITCSGAGSITHISIHHYSLVNRQFGRFLNGSSIPNLVSLDVGRAGLFRRIPPEMGTPSKLTHLNFSDNYLIGWVASFIRKPLSIGNSWHFL